MPENHRNDDGSYTVYIKDGEGHIVPVTLPAGPMADGVEDADRKFNSSEYTWNHLVDQGFHRREGNHEDTDGCSEIETDPMDTFLHRGPSVEEQVIGIEVVESVAVIETRKAISKLTAKQRDTYEKRYECDWTQEDVGAVEGKGKSTICMREKTIQQIVREQLKQNGIDETNIRAKMQK